MVLPVKPGEKQMTKVKTEATSEDRELTAEELSAVSGGMLAAFAAGDKVFYINSETFPLSNSHVAVSQR
jgi:hypothetical protein